MKTKKEWLKKEKYYLNQLLKKTTKKKIDTWLKTNKIPNNWQAGKYAYAYSEMIVLSKVINKIIKYFKKENKL